MLASTSSVVSVSRCLQQGVVRGARTSRRCFTAAAEGFENARLERDDKTIPHIPVLANQLLYFFEGRSVRTFLDCTVGAGGHAFKMIQAHPELETLVGFDVDPTAIPLARRRLEGVASNNMLELHLIHTNFKHMKKRLEEVDPDLLKHGVDGILMDLGLSSMQIDCPERGFSYCLDGPLDMRMDPTDPFSVDATSILNDWSENAIGKMIRDFGEDLRWRPIAQRIVDARLNGGVKTTTELADLIAGRFSRGRFKRRKHPAARTFQALRIAVNDELNILKDAISDAVTCLAPGGRLVIISFHSLEDRIVKYAFKELSMVFEKNDLAFRLLTDRPVIPETSEVEENIRCRSAKMRVIQKLCK